MSHLFLGKIEDRPEGLFFWQCGSALRNAMTSVLSDFIAHVLLAT
jgi:hypothetical protein